MARRDASSVACTSCNVMVAAGPTPDTELDASRTAAVVAGRSALVIAVSAVVARAVMLLRVSSSGPPSKPRRCNRTRRSFKAARASVVMPSVSRAVSLCSRTLRTSIAPVLMPWVSMAPMRASMVFINATAVSMTWGILIANVFSESSSPFKVDEVEGR